MELFRTLWSQEANTNICVMLTARLVQPSLIDSLGAHSYDNSKASQHSETELMFYSESGLLWFLLCRPGKLSVWWNAKCQLTKGIREYEAEQSTK